MEGHLRQRLIDCSSSQRNGGRSVADRSGEVGFAVRRRNRLEGAEKSEVGATR